MTLDIDTSPLTDEERASAKENARKKDEWTPVLPVPEGIELEIPHHRLGRPSTTWEYRDANGRLMFCTCRFDYSKDGEPKKDVIPLCYCETPTGRRKWRWKAPPVPRPLYRLDAFTKRPDAAVLVPEGEKKCQPAEALFPDFIAITSQGGAEAAENSDWSPVKGRRVVVWSDHDNAGARYATDVARLALAAGATEVRIVKVPAEFPPKWDLADALPQGWDATQLRKLLDAAKVVSASGGDDDAGGDDLAPEDEAEIERLARLCPIERDRERRAAAKRLNCRVSTLDDYIKEVRARFCYEQRLGTNANGNQGDAGENAGTGAIAAAASRTGRRLGSQAMRQSYRPVSDRPRQVLRNGGREMKAKVSGVGSSPRSPSPPKHALRTARHGVGY